MDELTHFKNSGESIMGYRKKAEQLESLINMASDLLEKEKRTPINFNDFLHLASTVPEMVFRDIFQLFHDMLHYYVPEGEDETPLSEHTIGYLNYDSRKLFVEDCDNPFFADRLFMNRLMNLAKGFRKGTFRNSIFLFEGPPGSGKSTFLNNLLQKLEEYAKTDAGTTYKVHWKLNKKKIGDKQQFLQKLEKEDNGEAARVIKQANNGDDSEDNLAFSCPNHDHPILMIPKSFRKQFIDTLVPDEEFKNRIFSEKQFEWILKDVPCTICMTIFKSLMDALNDPLEVYNMIYVRRNFYSRQLGEGISVFNPGDRIDERPITNGTQQKLVNDLFKNDDVKFTFSYLAKTNNGVLALMDIKKANVDRLINYHGIISDGIHKVGLHEERINTLFLGLVNPEDKVHYQNISSFQDRIVPVNIPYILDYNTELAIYKNKFGDKVVKKFLPRVLKNFAKIIISSRMDPKTPSIHQWISDVTPYSKQIDKDLLLLKMDIYSGKVPSWLSEKDLKKFDRNVRNMIIMESRTEGNKGCSGRQSLILLDRFLASHPTNGKLINMEMLMKFFNNDSLAQAIDTPKGFIDSIVDLYDFEVLQELKQSIYHYNEKHLSREIQDYLYAINFDEGVTKKSQYTGNTIEITEEYFKELELMFVGPKSSNLERKRFRKEVQNEYITTTLSQEIRVHGQQLHKTELYNILLNKYVKNLKENALAPYVNSENFRRAILDYGDKSFETYSDKLKRDVSLLIKNLQNNCSYTESGAKQICIYVLDRKLVDKYGGNGYSLK